MANFRTKAKTGPPSPLVRPRPAEDGNFVAFSAEGDGFSAYVHRDVLEFIERESHRAAPDEVIGLLAGRTCHDPERGPYTLVMAADGARSEEIEASPSHVHISATGNASVRRRLEDSHPDREIIGWYHSHPRYPAHFSHIDVAEQSTWSDPNHVGIVFSGTQKDEPFGVYRGPNAIRLSRRNDPQALATSRTAVARGRAVPSPELNRAGRGEHERVGMRIMRHEAVGRELRGKGVKARRIVVLLAALCLLFSVVWLHVRVNSIETALSMGTASASKSPALAATAETPPTHVQPARLTDTRSEAGAGTADQTLLTDAPVVQPAAKSITPQRKKTESRAGRDDAGVGRNARTQRNRKSASGSGDRTEQTRGTGNNSRPGGTPPQPATKTQPGKPPSSTVPPRTTSPTVIP